MGNLMFDTPTFELHANNGPLEIRVASSMMIVSFIGVCLRFYAKRITRQSYLWDDWLIVLGLLFSWGVCIVYVLAVRDGNLGQHIALLASPEPLNSHLRSLYILLYIQTILYLFSLACTKYSVSFFYRRLFQIRKAMTTLVFLEWFLGLRLVTILIVAIIPCIPITSTWDKTRPGKCINNDAFLAALAVTNVGTYLVLLGYPIPIVWNLRVVRAQKIGLLVVFVLGGFVVVVSCLRLAAIIELIGNPDITWALFPLALWTTIELNTAIFCACIPVMRPLLKFCPGQKQVASGHDGSTNVSVHKKWWPDIKTAKSADDSTNFRILPGDSIETEGNLDKFHFQTSVTGNRMELEEVELSEGIHEERTVTWT